MIQEDNICPSKGIWDYYNRGCNSGYGITISLILSSIADVIAGYHISYSATELLKDLGYINISKNKKTINKKGLLILSHELHERHHRGVKTYHIIVNPHDNSDDAKTNSQQATGGHCYKKDYE